MFDVALLKPSGVVLPVIPFDVDPLLEQLKEELKKYDGLSFTENDIKDLKAVITELNKAEKMIEDYRKGTKKEVEAPIKKFEEKMKQLKIMVVQTRSEFKETYDSFEADRKAKKEKEVKELTKMIIDDSDLFDPFIAQVPFKKEYLNKSMTMAKIEDDILSEVERLSQIQEVRNSRIEKIEDKCAILGYEMKVEIQPAGYVAMVDDKEVSEIIALIEKFAESEAMKASYPEEIQVEAHPELDEQPTEIVSFKKDPDVFTETWTLTGTEDQLLRAEQALKDIGIQVVLPSD